MKKLLLLLLIIPSLAFAREGFDKLKADLAPQGIILLDVFGQFKHIKLDGEDFATCGIVFAVEKGYGYSAGPFTGTILLKPDHWYEIVSDSINPFTTTYIRNRTP